jgi:hypothetical protein
VPVECWRIRIDRVDLTRLVDRQPTLRTARVGAST